MLLEIKKEDAIQEFTQNKEFPLIAFAFVLVFQIIVGKFFFVNPNITLLRITISFLHEKLELRH